MNTETHWDFPYKTAEEKYSNTITVKVISITDTTIELQPLDTRFNKIIFTKVPGESYWFIVQDYTYVVKKDTLDPVAIFDTDPSLAEVRAVINKEIAACENF